MKYVKAILNLFRKKNVLSIDRINNALDDFYNVINELKAATDQGEEEININVKKIEKLKRKITSYKAGIKVIKDHQNVATKVVNNPYTLLGD